MARSGVKIEVIKGKKVASLIPEFAQLRMTVFREYPYLYEGDFAEEFEYLVMYAKSSDSVFVIAKDGDRMIGAATGLPFSKSPQSIRDLFSKHRIKMESLFYFGELILLKEYRGHQIGQKMYDAFEQAVRKLGRYDRIAGMEIDHAASFINSSQDSGERGKARSKRSGPNDESIVEGAMDEEKNRSGKAAAGRIPDELMKEADTSAEVFFIKQGYVKEPHLVMHHSWKEIGSKKETDHAMVFLMKRLHEHTG